jgi:hypothetical protein
MEDELTRGQQRQREEILASIDVAKQQPGY